MVLKLLGPLDFSSSTLSLIKSFLYTTILLIRIVNIAIIICFSLGSVTFSHLVWIHISALLGSLNISSALAWHFLILLEVIWGNLVVHCEAGFAQLVYQVFNITLVMRLRQALIYKLILLVLVLWSLDSRHTTGRALIYQTSLILTIWATAFLWIKVATHFSASREAVKVGHHRSVRLRLLLILLRSWSTTRFKNKIKKKLKLMRKMTY